MNSAFKLVLAGLITASAVALAQQAVAQSLHKQLVGQWSLVSGELIDAKGNKRPLVEGADQQGFLAFFDNARFTFQIISAIPKLSSDRIATTPEESHAVARGVLSYYGTYTANDPEKTFTFKIERSSYPNQNGMEAKRVVQSLTADELVFILPARLAGGQNTLVWKRVR